MTERVLLAHTLPVYISTSSLEDIIGKHDPTPRDTVRRSFVAPVYIRQRSVDPATKGLPADVGKQITFVSESDFIKRQAARTSSHQQQRNMVGRVSQKEMAPKKGTSARPSNKADNKRKREPEEAEPASDDDTSVPTSEVDTSVSEEDVESEGEHAAPQHDDDEEIPDLKEDMILGSGRRVRFLQLGFNGYAKGTLGRQPTKAQIARQAKQYDPTNPRHMPSLAVHKKIPVEEEQKRLLAEKKRQYAEEKRVEADPPGMSILSKRADATDHARQAGKVATTIMDEIARMSQTVRSNVSVTSLF